MSNFCRSVAVGLGRRIASGRGLLSRTADRSRLPVGPVEGTPSPAVPLVVSFRCLPVCSVSTNLNKDQVPKDFLGGLSKVIAETLGKPEKSIFVSVSSDVRMFRSGNDGPTVLVEIWSIGVFDAERNKKYTKDIFKYITKELKDIPEDRVVLLFHPLQSEDAGHLIYKSLK